MIFMDKDIIWDDEKWIVIIKCHPNDLIIFQIRYLIDPDSIGAGKQEK